MLLLFVCSFITIHVYRVYLTFEGNAYPVPCSQDTFADTGQEACSSSLDGYYTNNGQQTICPAGHFCINGKY
jgi:hypothetical protein